MAVTVSSDTSVPGGAHSRSLAARALRFLAHRPVLAVGSGVLLLFVGVALLSPWLAGDPGTLNPLRRLKPPSAAQWFGTDHVGRSVFDRTLWGARISLGVGFAVAIATTLVGVLVGIVAGYFRLADTVIMRAMDAVMAIPAILLAIALVALVGSSPLVIVTAISVPEIPRMARMVRASVLVLREQAYVEAAITCGGRMHAILLRHILPGAAGPILVQATYVFASAMILEAILSFLGAGTPPNVPSWGNMMAEGRQYLQMAPWILGFPALGLALVVLSVNLLGDVLRDMLDPSLVKPTGAGGA